VFGVVAGDTYLAQLAGRSMTGAHIWILDKK
jgi:hypothetical protein